MQARYPFLKVWGAGDVSSLSEEDKKIVVAKDGTITVPAVACTGPRNNTEKVAFLKSWENGMQIHYQRLGVREYPIVETPVISVSTSLRGANAAVIESQVTEPIEESVNAIDGIRSITSTSNEGRSTVRVEFDLAYTKLNEKRVDRMWLDLIFDNPGMNEVILRDLTFSRRPRAEL